MGLQTNQPVGKCIDRDDFDYDALPHRCTKCKTNFAGAVEYMEHCCMENGWLPAEYTSEHGRWMVKAERGEIPGEYLTIAKEMGYTVPNKED